MKIKIAEPGRGAARLCLDLVAFGLLQHACECQEQCEEGLLVHDGIVPSMLKRLSERAQTANGHPGERLRIGPRIGPGNRSRLPTEMPEPLVEAVRNLDNEIGESPIIRDAGELIAEPIVIQKSAHRIF